MLLPPLNGLIRLPGAAVYFSLSHTVQFGDAPKLRNMLTDDYDVETEKMKVRDASGSDLEMNLDLPGGIKEENGHESVHGHLKQSANDSDMQ